MLLISIVENSNPVDACRCRAGTTSTCDEGTTTTELVKSLIVKLATIISKIGNTKTGFKYVDCQIAANRGLFCLLFEHMLSTGV